MPFDNADDLADGLARIQALTTSELRSLVVSTTGKPPSRQLSGDLLRRILSHRLQTQALGRLDLKMARLLDRLGNGGREGARRLAPGSVLTRELDGMMHQVMVVADGFSWQDRIYPSLSAVAKAMTGTTWNGHRFFGLKTLSGTASTASMKREQKGHRQDYGISESRP